MKTSNRLNVYYKENLVGTLAQADYRVAFEYADSWITGRDRKNKVLSNDK